MLRILELNLHTLNADRLQHRVFSEASSRSAPKRSLNDESGKSRIEDRRRRVAQGKVGIELQEDGNEQNQCCHTKKLEL